MTDHEQQGIERLQRAFAVTRLGDESYWKMHYGLAEAAFASLKASGYRHVPEGFVVVPAKAAYIYNPESWESTHHDGDLEELFDGEEHFKVARFARLAALPNKWAVNTDFGWQEFDTEEQATAAMIEATKKLL